MQNKTITEEEQIKTELREFTGTQTYYRHFTGQLLYTDGVRHMAEICDAFWLIDLIASHQFKKVVKETAFQIWHIEVNDDKTAYVYMNEDTDQPVITSQGLEYTDFPLPKFSLYLVDGVLLLKGEY